MARTVKAVIILAAVLSASACANTIRGIGQDTANAVDATQSAGRNITNAAR
jgi:entericidin B